MSFLSKVHAAEDKVFQVELVRTTTVVKAEEAFAYVKASTEAEAKTKAKEFSEGKTVPGVYQEEECKSEADLEDLEWEADPHYDTHSGDEDEFSYDVQSVAECK